VRKTSRFSQWFARRRREPPIIIKDFWRLTIAIARNLLSVQLVAPRAIPSAFRQRLGFALTTPAAR
jgi:hypothetical protein